jgi:hypothetical protein
VTSARVAAMTLHRQPPLSPHPAMKPVRPSHPALAALLARWQAYAGARPIPERGDLDFLNLRPWRGHLLLVDVFSHGRQFQTAPSSGGLSGPGAAVTAVIASRSALAAKYERAAAERCPVAATIEPREDTATPLIEVLILPLAGADGLVTALLIGAYECGSAEDADQSGKQER